MDTCQKQNTCGHQNAVFACGLKRESHSVGKALHLALNGQKISIIYDMGGNSKSAAAFIIAMDMGGFSKIPQSDQDGIIEHIYKEITAILEGVGRELLDKKTMGDGFIFYFSSGQSAINVAFLLSKLFSQDYIWKKHKINKNPPCRIALHFGQFFWFHDAIEKKKALFGRNIITAARLEPVVRENEIWCTRAFKEEYENTGETSPYKICELGQCQLAKGWSEQMVYGIVESKEKPPAALVSDKPEVIYYENSKFSGKFPNNYFALIRLKHTSDGVEHLRHCLKPSDFHIEAAYYLFGRYDVLLRFKAKHEYDEKSFSELLADSKIHHKKDKCVLVHVNFSSDEDKEPIMIFPKVGKKSLKAFIFVNSRKIVEDKQKAKRVLRLAHKALGKEGVATYYYNTDLLVLPVVIPTINYYALAEAVEAIEDAVDKDRLDDVRITTYPVHAFEEFFLAK